MGGRITLTNRRQAGGEPVADITAESSRLRGVRVGGELIPRLIDEVPVLALAAALAEGTTTIHDAAELRVKESDRLAAVAGELTTLGGQVEELPDGLVIRGTRSSGRGRDQSARRPSAGDDGLHRWAGQRRTGTRRRRGDGRGLLSRFLA